MNMSPAIAILFACLPLLAHAAPPVITEMRHEAGKVHITWRHPSNWDFEANWNGEGIRKFHYEAGRHGLRQFKWRVEPKPGTNTFAIRAVDEAGVPQEWTEQSLVVQDGTSSRLVASSALAAVRERLKWDGVMPPSPMNTDLDSTGSKKDTNRIAGIVYAYGVYTNSLVTNAVPLAPGVWLRDKFIVLVDDYSAQKQAANNAAMAAKINLLLTSQSDLLSNAQLSQLAAIAALLP